MVPDVDNNRIRELDFARGVAILCMVAVHFFYCAELFGNWKVDWTPFTYFVRQYCGAFFLVMSGIVVNFGSKNIKRGLLVLFCGFIFTAASAWLYISGREDAHVLYQWGVLQSIGLCMILYSAVKKLPSQFLVVLGLVMILTGYYCILEVRVLNPWLFPLGLRTRTFEAFDYKPLLPYAGWFTFGAGIGRIVYKDKKPLFPGFSCRPVEWVGRNSLIVYMTHLPVLYVLFKTVLLR